MIVVSDTSSVSALLRIGQGNLLQLLYGEVLIPEAVRAELLAFFPDLPEFLHCRQIVNTGEVDRLCEELDLGEAEAIVLARESHADILLMDELNGRRVAMREGVPIIGLMGVLIKAKNEGLVVSIRPLIEKLETEADFRLSAEFKQSTLRRAHEL
jgi:predicted nucleic acid-binding protein